MLSLSGWKEDGVNHFSLMILTLALSAVRRLYLLSIETK